MPSFHSLNCSTARKIKIVFGPNLTKLGSHPRNKKAGPSFLTESIRTFTALSWCWCAFIILVLITSAGEQIVVATKPANKEAVKCVVFLTGSKLKLVTREFLKTS